MSHRHPVYKASFHLAAVLAVVVLLPAVSLAGPVQQQAPEEPATEQPAEQSAEQPAEQPARGVPAPRVTNEGKPLPPMVSRAVADAASSGEGAGPLAPPEPPDGTWLVDDEGREYYVDRLEKYEGQVRHKYLPDGRLRYLGVTVDVVEEDDEWFYIKVYRTYPTEGVGTVNQDEPTEEELAAAEATYPGEGPEVDRIQLVRFDQGLPASGQWRNGFDLADMNGDGVVDIVHAPPRKGVPWPVVFLGDGQGGWRVWDQLGFPRRYDYGDATVADYNGDGKQDIALGIHLQGLRVLVGDGNGKFREWSQGIDYQVPGAGGDARGFSSRTVASVDWNRDGLVDVLALGEGPRLARAGQRQGRSGPMSSVAFVADGPVIFLNQGDGRWQKKAEESSTKQVFGDDMALGDFDGDGKSDFITSSNRLAFRGIVYYWRPGGEFEIAELPGLRPNAYLRAVAAADFDGDGRDDVAISYVNLELGVWRVGIDIFYPRADGEWQRRPLYSRAGREAIFALSNGDLDADGHQDLMSFDQNGDGMVFVGDGEGFFIRDASPELIKPRGRCRSYRVGLGDLNGDGRAEAVANFADEASALFDPDRCPSGGGLAVWRAVEAEPAEEAPAP